jgi:hypothetical protein
MTYKIGTRVRFVHVHDPLDPEADDWGTIGEEGVVTGEGRYFLDDWEAGYDCIASFPSYPQYCAWNWQLEPILDRHEPCESDFKESLDKLLSEVSCEAV